jgi:hypothetical protein
MGVAKVGGDTAVKTKTAPAVNRAFCHRVNHGSGRKLCTDIRAAVDNRQQWQQQSGNNQLNVTVASGGLDSRGGGSKQRRSMAFGSKTPMAKVIAVVPPTPLLLPWAGGGGWAAVAVVRE